MGSTFERSKNRKEKGLRMFFSNIRTRMETLKNFQQGLGLRGAKYTAVLTYINNKNEPEELIFNYNFSMDCDDWVSAFEKAVKALN